LNIQIQTYLDEHCSPQSDLLSELNRETHLKTLYPRMLSGHYQGRLLSIISKLKSPEMILEIGTFTGYSALCLAEGLACDGLLYTVESNEEVLLFAKSFFARSRYSDRIIPLLGNASAVVATLKGPFDLVFIDADKKNNERYVHEVLPLVKKGGLILIDNVLWSGKVVAGESDVDTVMISAMNDRLSRFAALECVILPVRDGLMLLRKL